MPFRGGAVAPGFPVLFVSGFDTMQHVDAMLGAGGIRFLRKPFTREAFHVAITDLLSVAPAAPDTPGG